MLDEEVVVAKLRSINQYTDDLKQMRGLTEDEYLDDMVTRRAVERTFVTLIQACIDLARHIRTAENLQSGNSSKAEIEAIERAGIITTETSEVIVEAVGFRNVLAHQYDDVDHRIVYDVLHDDLHWFERFQQEVAQWLRDEDPEGHE